MVYLGEISSNTESSTNLLNVESSNEEFQKAVIEKKNSINLADSQTIMAFGIDAQKSITEISEEMLNGVRNKDLGPAGEALNDMISKIRGFNLSELEAGKSPNMIGRLLGKIDPIVKFTQQYETAHNQMVVIQDKLTTHRTKLIKDIVWLDRLYDTTLDYFHILAVYIQAAKEKLLEIDSEVMPSLLSKANNSNDLMDSQKYRDISTIRDDLERKLHDLELTRQVVMQNLPSIRLYQENDKMLVNKIQSMLLNTLPLWKNQLAQAITLYRSQDALKTLKLGNDLNNELLVRNWFWVLIYRNKA